MAPDDAERDVPACWPRRGLAGQTTVVSELASILLANGSRFALRIEGVHNADSASATPMHMPSTVGKITGRFWPRPQR